MMRSFRRSREGEAAQILHIGPFAEKCPTVEILHRFIRENGFQFHGKHHDIHLTDTRRAASFWWKTILRQPIKKIFGNLFCHFLI